MAFQGSLEPQLPPAVAALPAGVLTNGNRAIITSRSVMSPTTEVVRVAGREFSAADIWQATDGFSDSCLVTADSCSSAIGSQAMMTFRGCIHGTDVRVRCMLPVSDVGRAGEEREEERC